MNNILTISLLSLIFSSSGFAMETNEQKIKKILEETEQEIMPLIESISNTNTKTNKSEIKSILNEAANRLSVVLDEQEKHYGSEKVMQFFLMQENSKKRRELVLYLMANAGVIGLSIYNAYYYSGANAVSGIIDLSAIWRMTSSVASLISIYKLKDAMAPMTKVYCCGTSRNYWYPTDVCAIAESVSSAVYGGIFVLGILAGGLRSDPMSMLIFATNFILDGVNSYKIFEDTRINKKIKYCFIANKEG